MCGSIFLINFEAVKRMTACFVLLLLIFLPEQVQSGTPEDSLVLERIYNFPRNYAHDVSGFRTNVYIKHLYQTERFTIAYPVQHKDLIEYMYSCFTCVSVGFGLSELRGHHQAPQHSLSMAKDINTKAFATIDLDLQTALSYLRTEAIVIESAPIGYVLLTYRNIPLGFAKNVGGRCNNLYPNEWRIRTL